ncbi:capsule biosynthesis GfcC family protein [Aliiglaciecola sp. LCG003]|uniref:capsule biosynthesis GfcC family protein n=1 Tax=Aliiglaciecola sp. LCG003 TaxID=3053655 RepID=UPI002573B703|nr:capsule biosynthesis GfcC family protein [Aliiglaciecola sp. LCG003]WJG09490.1 capsule biosynthesis GfcC family protein [Aliiglaciecola sp. LCG003]
MNKILITTLCLICTSFYAKASVQVELNGSTYQFTVNPRLTEVLAPVALKSDWYWPASQIFKLGSADIESTRLELINKLAEKGKGAGKHKKAFQNTINQVKSWQLAKRIKMEVDFDFARFSLAHNPQFEDGRYVIALSERKTALTIFGALEESRKIEYKDNQCIQDVISQYNKSAYAEEDFVYVIYPNTQVYKMPVAYWNKECSQVMPGSQIFIPFREFQFLSEIEQLNWAIANLAINRMDV